jgi:hypothetical protein
VQAWYNEWIKPDPTVQNSDGVPTRLTFGLEEIWMTNPDPVTSLTTPFVVIGPYFSGSSCQFRGGIPVCPTTGTKAGDTTTHPDQHDGLYIPDKSGGVTLVVGNDGGAYTQHVTSGQNFTSTRWGAGKQIGLHTLLPYDVAPARDGTIWFGLQDNGQGKLTPDNKQYEAYGGDAFFSAVDPNNSKHAYEEYTYGAIRVTTDGGFNWTDISPACAAPAATPAEPNCISDPQFTNPFAMDPTDANHLMTAGPEVVETVAGPNTRNFHGTGATLSSWKTVYNLGTQPDGTTNQMSAIDVRGDAAYVGFCGVCDIINAWDVGFHNGLATNVGGSQPPKRQTSQGWHNAALHGLPNRMITSIAIDPNDVKTVYVTLGGYNGREWVPPGSYLDANKKLGAGHVFVSHDAGNHFTNVSGNLPDTVATWVTLHGSHMVIGTDIGAFISSDLSGSKWYVMGDPLPAVLIGTIRNVPGADNLMVAATFGRGVYCFRFAGPGKATCANRGANFRPGPSAGKKLAPTGLPVALPVLAGLLLAVPLLVFARRRHRTGTT